MAQSWDVKIDQSVLPAARAAAAEALNTFAALVHDRAVNKAPKDEGHLRRSATVIPATADNLRAVVTFDTPYAARQHEEMGYKHTDGQAKYLESAMNESAQDGKAIIARAVGGS